MLSSATRTLILYHLSFLNSWYFVVSFSEASKLLMLEMPTTHPPQPPQIRLQKDLRTGNVRPQKKSSPFRFIACSVIS